MRTTLNLNDDLIRQAKQRALAEERTLTSVIEDALRRLLEEVTTAPAAPYRVRAMNLSGLVPGLDPNDPAFYQAVLEQEDIERYGRLSRSGDDAAV